MGNEENDQLKRQNLGAYESGSNDAKLKPLNPLMAKNVRTVRNCSENVWLRRAKPQNPVTLLAKNKSHFRPNTFYMLKQGVLLVLRVI